MIISGIHGGVNLIFETKDHKVFSLRLSSADLETIGKCDNRDVVMQLGYSKAEEIEQLERI